MEWQPRDVIAIVIIVGGMILLYLGINEIVAIALMAVVAFYYGGILAYRNYEKYKAKKEARKKEEKNEEKA